MTTVQRIRHDAKFRLLEVQQVVNITPKMLRVTLSGDQLDGFVSAAHDDHAKIFFPPPGQAWTSPSAFEPGDGGLPNDTIRRTGRDYTPRRYDPTANTLEIDFVLHGDGPGSSWAAQARPGQWLGVGGPRGSFVITEVFDWYLLVGDETALPAIGRRLEELPAGARAIVVAEVADAHEEQHFTSNALVDIVWAHRDGGEPGDLNRLLEALTHVTFPSGEGYAWIAAEASVAKGLRQHLVDERGVRKDRVKAAAYWKRGAMAVHETYND